MTPHQYNTTQSSGSSAFAIEGIEFFFLEDFKFRSKIHIEYKYYIAGNATSFLSTVSDNL